METRRKKIIITGGHLSPAWATIEELQKRGWQAVYLGRKTATEGSQDLSDEARLIPQLGVEFVPLATGRLQRKLTRYTLTSLTKIPLGWISAIRELKRIRPNLVLSFGGYLSLPVVVSAWLLKTPVVTHEQTRTAGLANQINAKFARKVAISFLESAKYFSPEKVVVTGNPVRNEIEISSTRVLKKFKDFSPKSVIYVTGGSQGGRDLNLPVIKILPELLKKYHLIHQLGSREIQRLSWQMAEEFLKTHRQLKSKYLAQEYFDPQEIGTVFSLASLVISRAGANTISELAHLGKPAILVPLPNTHNNEQLANARAFAKTGLGVVMEEKDLTPEVLLAKIENIMENLGKYQHQAKLAKQELIVANAAKKLADLIEEVIKNPQEPRELTT